LIGTGYPAGDFLRIGLRDGRGCRLKLVRALDRLDALTREKKKKKKKKNTTSLRSTSIRCATGSHEQPNYTESCIRINARS